MDQDITLEVGELFMSLDTYLALRNHMLMISNVFLFKESDNPRERTGGLLADLGKSLFILLGCGRDGERSKRKRTKMHWGLSPRA